MANHYKECIPRVSGVRVSGVWCLVFGAEPGAECPRPTPAPAQDQVTSFCSSAQVPALPAGLCVLVSD